MKSLREALKPSRFFPVFLPVLGLLLISAAANAQKTTAPTKPTTATTLPTLTSLSVTSVTTPSAAFTLTATGTNFVMGTGRRERGETEIASEEYGRMNATVNSATQITVSVPPLRDVTAVTVLHIYVETPGVGRSPEASDLTFTLTPVVKGSPPTLVSLSETSVTTPTKAFMITATGTNFETIKGTPFHTQVVSTELGPLPTTVNSATQLTISFPPIRDVKSAIVLNLYVKNPDGTESATGAELTFTINPPVLGPAPTLTSLSETSITTPSKSSTFTVTGANFIFGEGRWNDSFVASEEYGPLETTANSATELTVHLPRLRTVTTAITLHLYVQNPDGSRSLAADDIVFTINPPGTTTTAPIKGTIKSP